MTPLPPQFENQSEVDAHLEQLLLRWADHRRLSPSEAESIRRSILETDVETVAPLPDGWWQSFRERFQHTLYQFGSAKVRDLPPFDYHLLYHRPTPISAPEIS